MKRGTLIAAVVLAIGAFACERKHDDTKAGDTTTTSGTVHEEQNTGTGTYGYQGSPGVTGDTSGTDRNANVNDNGALNQGAGSSLSADQSSGTWYAKDAGIAADFDKKDGGHVSADFDKKDGGHIDMNKSTPSTGTSKGKTGSGRNTSTSLGDSTSGESTGGQGTYGGKATHGTGPGSDIKK